ncbi:MAG: class I SAM-dependent methyltransferase [Bacteroidales bacterium]
MKQLIKKIIPVAYHKQLKYAVLRKIYFGRKHYCNVCNSNISKWLPLGYDLPVIREKQIVGAGLREAMCPVCMSSDRIRLLYHFLQNKTTIFSNPNKLLHIAPEPSLEHLFINHKNIDYLTADLNPDEVMMQMDITRISFPENTFDAIMCNHVLEHIPDDQLAMSELFRVLEPGGWAILQVPFSKILDKTFENPEVKTPEERERVFGQTDHVRIYGNDYVDRLEKAGFTVNRYQWTEDPCILDSEKKLNLNPDEPVFFCTK